MATRYLSRSDPAVQQLSEVSGMRLAVYRWLENNAGDEAVYEGLTTAFPPDVEWVNIGLEEQADEALAALQRCDGLVIGGGTILGNLRTWVLDPSFLDGAAVPIGILGTGIRDEGSDSIGDDVAPALHRLLEKADPIALRGPLSAEFLRDSGFGGHSLQVAGDPALLLTKPPMAGVGTAINVRVRPGGGERQTVQMLRELVSAEADCLPRPISFFSCHDRWDLNPCVLPGPIIQPYRGLDELLDRLGGCQLVISERLHGTVLAHVAGTPAVQIVYERKCEDYMASVGCQDLCVWPGEVDGLRRACASAAGSMPGLAAEIEKRRLALREAIHGFLDRVHGHRRGYREWRV